MQIANRESFAVAARKRTPTARDYVQDGLIAMWDGKENAGWGQHNASATTWADLIGGSWGSWNIQGVGADYVTFSSAAQLKSLSTFTVPATIEMSLFDWVDMGGAFLNFGDRASWNSLSSSGCLCPYHTNSASGTDMEFYSKHKSVYGGGANIFSSTISVFYSGSAVRCLVNGSAGERTTSVTNTMSYSALSIGRYASKVFTAKVRFLRFYNRVLTASELAANNEIDRERFNLP